MDDIAGITKKVTNKENDWSNRFTRMDRDYDRWRLKAYELDKRKNTISITNNDPRTYADALQRTIGMSKRNIGIYMAEREGPDVRDDVSKLERLFDFGLEMADKRLRRLGMPLLKHSLTWYGMIRGLTAARVLVYMDGKNAIFDINALDPRWLTYEIGNDGFLWVAHKEFISQEALEAEYPGKSSSNWVSRLFGTKKRIPLLDYWEWDKVKKKAINSIICDGNLLGKNEVSSMPFVIAPISTRPSASSESEDYIEDDADSIYASARGVYDTMNWLASLWASQANIIARKPVLNYKGPHGQDLDEVVFQADKVIDLVKGENELVSMPVDEVSGTLLSLYGEQSAQRQRATLADVEHGQLNLRLSGVGIGELKEPSGRPLWAILSNLDYIYTGICELMEEQILTGGADGKVKGVKTKGVDGKKYFEEEIKPVDIKRPHVIKVSHTALTPWQQMDILQVAQMAKLLGIPDEVIFEELLQFQDPKRIQELQAVEAISKDPVMMIYKGLNLLHNEGRRDEENYFMQLLAKLSQEQLTQPTMEGGAPTEGAMPPEGKVTPPEEAPPEMIPPETGGMM